MENIAVFCASSSKVDNIYLESAYQTGEIISKLNKKIIYGGGSVGLMGQLANAALLNKCHITGVIPEFMMEMEWGNRNINELIIVEDMFERKKLILEKSDAIITLPGGCGTIDELFDAITHKQLCRINAPIILLNINGFFNPIIKFLESAVKQRFMRPEHSSLFKVINKVSQIPEALNLFDSECGFTLKDAQL